MIDQHAAGDGPDLADWLRRYKRSAHERRAQREQAELEAAERRQRERAGRPLPRYHYREPDPWQHFKSRLARLIAIAEANKTPQQREQAR